MTDAPRPSDGHPLPSPPFDVVVLGAGRVGRSYARALRSAGHRVLAELGRSDDPSPIASANVVVIAVPDDALPEAAAVVERLGRPGTVVIHTCGILGTEPLARCGSLVAVVHPAVPVATTDHDFAGAKFGVTAAEGLREWCDRFVRDLGGEPHFVPEETRSRYHAALSMASNFAVALAGDASDLIEGRFELLVPLLRATIENVARLGPDAALTGPIVRGDADTVRAHLDALPPDLIEVYLANARRTLARAVSSGRLDADGARRIAEALEEAMVP